MSSMYIILYVKCRNSCHIFMTLEFFDRISKNTYISNFTKIRPAAVELFRVERRKEGQTDRYDIANSRFAMLRTFLTNLSPYHIFLRKSHRI